MDLKGTVYARQSLSPRLSALAEYDCNNSIVNDESIAAVTTLSLKKIIVEVVRPSPNQCDPDSDVVTAERSCPSSSWSQLSAPVASTFGSLVSTESTIVRSQRVSQTVTGFSVGLQSSETVLRPKELGIGVSQKTHPNYRSRTERIDSDFCRESWLFRQSEDVLHAQQKAYLTPPPPDELSLLLSGNATPTPRLQAQVALVELNDVELPSISKAHSLEVTRFIKVVELKPPSYKRDRKERLAKAKRKDYLQHSRWSSIAIANCCLKW